MNKIITLILLLSFTGLFAGMEFQIQTEEPILRNNNFSNQLPKLIKTGEPMLPFNDFRILLPQGAVPVDIQIQMIFNKTNDVSYIEYAQAPAPISKPLFETTPPSAEIYEKDAYYPYNEFEVLGVQRKNGHDILVLNVYPYRYNPVQQKLQWASEFTISITTEQSEELYYQQNRMLLHNNRIKGDIAQLVYNPETLSSYNKNNIVLDNILPDPDYPLSMIVISSPGKEAVFNEFIQWKENKGISTGFFSTADIYEHYSGVDNQEKIRAFILDAYTTYAGTDNPLEYVVLGGDDNIIPIRSMYGVVGNYVDYNMPSDLYYSNLDGNWDANGNGVYGEVNDGIDWFAEVSVGRIPAYSDIQFERFFAKTYYYVDQKSYSNDIAYMMGENLDNHPTWGGDYKDEVKPLFPTDFHIDTIYERDGNFSNQAVIDAFHSGLAIINHIGHANHNIVFGLNNSRISALRNTEYGFAYTQGCYPAAFDNATSMESGAVGQNLTTSQGGLFAFIGNTRYGWYRRGSTAGASQAFDLTFFSALFNQEIRQLGNALNYSKEVLVNYAMTESVMRWIYYELILFGDPSVAVKDPLGIFPYIEPISVIYEDDEGDGVVNPGESVAILVEIKNLDNWADAEVVTASLLIDNDYIDVINDTVLYGNIQANSTSINSSNPFLINLDENIPYGKYEFSLKLDAYGVGEAYYSRIFKIEMPVTLVQKNWPWHYDKPINANPVVLDIDNNGFQELVSVDYQGAVSFLNSDTSSNKEQIDNDELLWRSTAFGDISGNGEIDIAISSRKNKILAMSLTGETLFSFDNIGQIVLTPVIADITNNNSNEVIVLDLEKRLFVINNSGNVIDGFPVELSQTALADLAVADITGDGFKEIIVGTIDGILYAVRYDGTQVDGFPLNLGAQIVTAPTILHNFDILVSTSNNRLFLISKEGTVLLNTVTQGRVSMEIIAADFTGNNSLEFAYVTNNGYINIIKRNGQAIAGYPISINGTFLYPPLAADMNGDGNINLICVTSNGTFYGFNSDGTALASLPFPLNININAPITLADIDNDGDLDIIAATSTGLIVIDYKYPYQGNLIWTTYRADYQRTGFYGEDSNLGVEEIPAQITSALKQNYPNPFNPNTRIDFSVAKDTNAKLEIFNIKGQKIRTLLDSHLKSGAYTVDWNGVDERDNRAGSGIYFYRLSTDENNFYRKMIMLR